MKLPHNGIYAVVPNYVVNATRFIFVGLHPLLKLKVPSHFGYRNDSKVEILSSCIRWLLFSSAKIPAYFVYLLIGWMS